MRSHFEQLLGQARTVEAVEALMASYRREDAIDLELYRRMRDELDGLKRTLNQA